MTLELFDFGMESIRLFGDKNRVFMRYYQLFNGILDSFPLIIELFNNYIDSGTQSVPIAFWGLIFSLNLWRSFCLNLK